MTTTAKKPRAAKLPGVVVARESLDHLLREFSSGALPVSEEFQRKIWFTRLLDAGWKVYSGIDGLARIARPGKEHHIVRNSGCDCEAWRFKDKCQHMRAFIVLGRTVGIRELTEWFASREVMG